MGRNFTFARGIDDIESRGELGGNPGSALANVYNRRLDRGLSGNSIKHRLISSVVYELPFGKGQRWMNTGRVMNAILGGMFTSRVNMNLREKHGYTYGARSHFVMRHGAGPFLVGASVFADKTIPSIKEMFLELEGLANRGYVMDSGEVTMTGEAKALLNDPKVRAAYLGE